MEPVNHRITDCLPYYESGREIPFDLLKKPHGFGLGAEIPDCHPEERIGICPIGLNAGEHPLETLQSRFGIIPRSLLVVIEYPDSESGGSP